MKRVSGPEGFLLAYDVVGSGNTILALHGAYSTSDELRPLAEDLAVDGMRVLLPDLPGMGESSTSTARDARDLLGALDALLEAEVPTGRFAVLGHSWGGSFARGVAARHAHHVSGLALLCPVVPGCVPAASGWTEDEGGAEGISESVRADYLEYFVVRTPATARMFERAVVPALARFDEGAAEGLLASEAQRASSQECAFDGPSLVLTARHDTFVGWRAQRALRDDLPGSTWVLVADAGHAVLHERPAVVRALLGDWLRRLR